MARLKKWGVKPGGNWFSVVRAACQLYSVTSESGIMRVESGGNSRSLFDQMIAFPQQAAHIIHYSFRNAYDINTTNIWTQGASGSGTALTVQDTRGGKAKFINGTSDDNYYNYVANYEVVRIVENKHTWFFTTIEVGNSSKADIFVGLTAKIAHANFFDSRVDSIGFYITGGVTYNTLHAECRKDSVATSSSTSFTLPSASEVCIGFHIVSNEKVLFFAGSSPSTMYYRCAIATNLPDDEELAVAFGMRNYGAVSNQYFQISGIKVLMDI